MPQSTFMWTLAFLPWRRARLARARAVSRSHTVERTFKDKLNFSSLGAGANTKMGESMFARRSSSASQGQQPPANRRRRQEGGSRLPDAVAVTVGLHNSHD